MDNVFCGESEVRYFRLDHAIVQRLQARATIGITWMTRFLAIAM